MYTYTYGGKKGQKVNLKIAEDRVVVRTKNARTLQNAVHSPKGKKMLQNFEVERIFHGADVSILQTKKVRRRGVSAAPVDQTEMRDEARKIFKKEPELRFAGRVLVDETAQDPVLYTENIFIKFKNAVSAQKCEAFLEIWKLTLKRKVAFAKNAYFAAAADGTGLKIFELCEEILEQSEVELCHPELVRHCPRKTVHEKQWHLEPTIINDVEINAHANVSEAHKITRGKGITVAIVDDGVDIDHPEFNIPGKVTNGRDVSLRSNDPRPKFWDENHGTACAGVATAAGINATGVAPDANLMPIRLASVLGSMAEADAFMWAAENGADIISCSWGPNDGAWYRPNDPAHDQYHPIPDSTRLAIEFAATKGRNGKGCIICWAAGNGNEPVTNDGYASFDKVIAVGACNDTEKRSVYSDFGDSLWVVFPSGDFAYQAFNHPTPLTRGIYTTDRSAGMGYNSSDYTDDFTGTSSATPGVAGVAALMLSANPDMTAKEVKNVLAQTATKIDRGGGNYNSKGHSPYYGYGRIDALKAVEAALSMSQVVVEEPTVEPEVQQRPVIQRPPQSSADHAANISVMDNPPRPAQLQKEKVRITEALVDPPGRDAGNETVTFKNEGAKADMTGWSIVDGKGRIDPLVGTINPGEVVTFVMTKVKLANTKGEIYIKNKKGKVLAQAFYNKKAIDKETGAVTF